MNQIDTRRTLLGSHLTELFALFMGSSPIWYKRLIIVFLMINPAVLTIFGPFLAGWLLLAEFIVTLALALKCNPLLPGGLLLIEAIFMGLVTPKTINDEVVYNLPILFLVLFVVTAVSFLKEFLTFIFMRVIISVNSKTMLSFLFCFLAAVLSALLDALTVTAVICAVFTGLYGIYERYASTNKANPEHDLVDDESIHAYHREDLMQFRSFLRGLSMHSVVGTMLGGIMTIIGEPQNLLIGSVMEWEFVEFIQVMSPVTLPVLISGLVMCIFLELFGWLDFGSNLPDNVRNVLRQEVADQDKNRTLKSTLVIFIQALSALALAVMLVFHVAEIYIIGLFLLIGITSLTGKNTEHQVGEAAAEGVPFVFVLAVFFGMVGMVHTQHLFAPVTDLVLSFDGTERLVAYFVSTGLLSAISDNVFVASLYIGETKQFFDSGVFSREEFEHIAVAINTGTNIPSISTPNGQAAFLFLLMSPLAKLIRLSYGRMVVLALPYALLTTAVGILSIWLVY